MLSLLASICLTAQGSNPGTTFTGGIGIRYVSAVNHSHIKGQPDGCFPNLTLTTNDGRTVVLDMPPKLLASYGDFRSLVGHWAEATGQLTKRASEVLVVKKFSPIPDWMAPKGVQTGDPKPIGRKSTISKPFVLLPVKFADQASEPYTQAQLTTLMGNAKPGMDHYFREQSYNEINLAGTVVKNWKVLPQPRSYYLSSGGYGMDPEKLATDAIALFDGELDYRTFYGINILMNVQTGTFGGLGGPMWMTLDGESRLWGRTIDNPTSGLHNLFAHEMGHSFNFDHSSGPYNTVYDSDWDQMSKGSNDAVTFPPFGGIAPHTNAYHREKIGWLPKSRVFLGLPGTNQSITLNRLAVTSANYQSARIYPDGDGSHYITVEARRYGGEYEQAGVIPGEGVVLHDVLEGRQVVEPFNMTTVNDRRSQVIDIDNNSNPNDAAAIWVVGETYNGPNGVTVQVTGSTATSYTVSINVPVAIPSPATVRTTADSGPGCLRGALYYLNYVGTGGLEFQIPAGQLTAGVAVFNLLSPLPLLDVPGITIDGATQTSFGGNTNPNGPEVYIDGLNAGNYTCGFEPRAANLTIRNLGIGRFKQAGIRAEGALNLTVESCFIGVSSDGAAARTCREGVTLVNGANGAMIGGVGKGNVIGGSEYGGIYVGKCENVVIRSNRIGTNAAGTSAVSNNDGIVADGDKNLVIDKNLLSGNPGAGAFIRDVDGGSFTGNLVGTNAAGTGALANGNGVHLYIGSKNYTVGGTTPATRNVFSGNKYNGLYLTTTTDCNVFGNYMGLNLTGTAAVANGYSGLVVARSTVRTNIGNGLPSGRNVVSGNLGVAVYLTYAPSPITFDNNFVGTDALGMASVSNGNTGIYMDRVDDSTIANSIISGNVLGVWMTGDRCTVSNCMIGLAVDGETVIPNTSAAITIDNGASDDFIDRNWIASSNSGIIVGKGPNHRIERNSIGSSVSGKLVGCGQVGILISGTTTTAIVGSPRKGNLIVGFTESGMQVSGGASCIIQGNFIGIDEKGRDLASGLSAIVLFNGTKNNLIGGDRNLGEGNHIGGCDLGIVVFMEATDGNSFRGNTFLSIADQVIDLNLDGVSVNDNLDSDLGANDTVNFPVLTSSTRYGGGRDLVQGSLSARPNQTYIIELYGSRGIVSITGRSPAEQPLTTASVTTNAQGMATFAIPTSWVGTKISATATEVSTGNTSEVSNAIDVSGKR